MSSSSLLEEVQSTNTATVLGAFFSVGEYTDLFVVLKVLVWHLHPSLCLHFPSFVICGASLPVN